MEFIGGPYQENALGVGDDPTGVVRDPREEQWNRDTTPLLKDEID